VPDESFDMARCLNQVAQGDQQAAEALIAHTHPLVSKLVRAHRARHHSDDDLTQEVYLTMFARLDRYQPQPGVPFVHWLARLAVNVCRDVLRAESRRPQAASLTPEAIAGLRDLRDVGPQNDAAAARELVEYLLRQLSVDDRLVLSLLDLDQRSVAEISECTGWSISAVKVRAFRARARLRELADRLPDGWRP
jgi:RNA polymerase sigma factor (sigma-70 family)